MNRPLLQTISSSLQGRGRGLGRWHSALPSILQAPHAPSERATGLSTTVHTFACSLLLIALAAFSACEKNTAPVPAPEVNPAGSYAATNTADCLPDINLVDQYGRATSLSSLKGRPVLIDFFYATCPNVCPRLTAKFASIANLLGSELGSKVTIVSITLDPENDHPGDLLKYARTHEADHAGWVFLTGKPEQIDAVLKIFHLKRDRDTNGMIMHVAMGFLLGPDGHQLRIYNALDVPPTTVVADIGHILPPS
jgi:cytochrome oxidase Cu insertion factor (SCO1/SenC/PrrC family)